jgi:hypothetical protein
MSFRLVKTGRNSIAGLLAILVGILVLLTPGKSLLVLAQETNEDKPAMGKSTEGVDEEYDRLVQEPGKIGDLEKAVEKAIKRRSLSETLDLHLYGYVDVSYVSNFGNPADGTNSLRGFDVDSDSFRVHMAQIVLEKQGKTGGELADHAGFRVKLDFGEDSQFTGGSDFSDEVDFQEVYAQFVVPFKRGVDIRLGRQNTLIGFEVIESPYNPNFSRSWLFSFGEPFTTTGVRGAYDFTDNLSFAIGGISSFTEATGDTNGVPSLETALSWKITERISTTGFFFWGAEGPRNSKINQDIVLGGGIFNFLATDKTTFTVEAYYANQANVSTISGAGNGRWDGVAAYVIHDFSDQWGFRVRGEIFEDAGGTRTCLGTLDPPRADVCFGATASGTADINGIQVVTAAQPGSFPTAQTMWETTYTLLYKPVPSLMTRLEYRYDKSNKNTFIVGDRAASYQNTLSFEAIYLF